MCWDFWYWERGRCFFILEDYRASPYSIYLRTVYISLPDVSKIKSPTCKRNFSLALPVKKTFQGLKRWTVLYKNSPCILNTRITVKITKRRLQPGRSAPEPVYRLAHTTVPILRNLGYATYTISSNFGATTFFFYCAGLQEYSDFFLSCPL